MFDRLIIRRAGSTNPSPYDHVFSRFYDDVTGNLLSTTQDNSSSLATRFISGDDLDQVFAQLQGYDNTFVAYNCWFTEPQGSPRTIVSEQTDAPYSGAGCHC